MSIGERIKGARAMAGLSQRALADVVGVSAMAISKYENDHDTPSSSVLIHLARALNVKMEYFFRESKVRLSAPAYRLREPLPKMEETRIREQVQEWIERYLDVESLFNEETNYSLLSNQSVMTFEDVEEVATNLRDHWSLGNDAIENLIGLLEDRGVKVTLIDGHASFDALTLWANNNIPVIVVNRDVPGDRQRFNLAHELGHIVIGAVGELDPEKVAHRFAGAFLVPRSVAEFELGKQRKTLGLYELHMLKHKYGLSMNAWIYRAKDLGILSEQSAGRLFDQFKKKGFNRKEPGEQMKSAEPQRLKRLVDRALAEDMISRSRASELLGMPVLQFYKEEAERHGNLPIELRG